MNPHGKVALITGGAHRVGKAITLMLAQAGANVIINYHTSADDAQQTLREVQTFGVDTLAIQCDVSDWTAVSEMTAQIEAKFGGVDILINAASLFAKTPFPSQTKSTIEQWQRVTRISIDGAYYVCNALVPGMIQRIEKNKEKNQEQTKEMGVIINIVDLSLWKAWKGYTAHAVGKAGLMALTQQLALELAPTIRVNAVAPGLVLPPNHYTPQQIERTAKHLPLAHWGSPNDVAQAVKYLIEADFVTGEVLRVDGGEKIVS